MIQSIADAQAGIQATARPDNHLAATYQPRAGTRTASASSRIVLERARKRVFVPQSARLGRHLARWSLITIDAILVGGAFWLFNPHTFGLKTTALCSIPLIGCAALAVYLAGGYRLEDLAHGVALKTLALIASAGALAGGLALRAAQAWDWLPSDARATLALITMLAVGYGLWVTLSRGLLRSMLRAVDQRARVLVIGDHLTASDLVTTLRDRQRFNPVIHLTHESADLDSPSQEPDSHGLLRADLSSLDQHLCGWVKAIVIDRPIDALPTDSIADLVHARMCNIPIISPAQLHEELWERVPITTADRSWVFTGGPFHRANHPLFQGSKRLIDLAVSGIGLIALAPVFAVIALMITITSPGPVFFRQIRVGRGKQEFKIVKFRSMRTDAEKNGAQWASTNDARVTKIGAFMRKCRIDELPQLWNVFMGDMSLVGPRPERPEFNRDLEELIPYYDLRHMVKPGITGWAQVCYPYGASVDDAIAKLEYDCYYLKHAGAWLDTRILIRTVAVCLGLRGR